MAEIIVVYFFMVEPIPYIKKQEAKQTQIQGMTEKKISSESNLWYFPSPKMSIGKYSLDYKSKCKSANQHDVVCESNPGPQPSPKQPQDLWELPKTLVTLPHEPEPLHQKQELTQSAHCTLFVLHPAPHPLFFFFFFGSLCNE